MEAALSGSGVSNPHETVATGPAARAREARVRNDRDPPFHDAFVELFDAHFPRLFRFLDRLSGDPDLAADLAQDAFIRLYRRRSMPDSPEAWLISVAMNLFRNTRTTRARRRRLLTLARGEGVHSDAPPSPASQTDAGDIRRRIRAALDRLAERERSILLLRAEGYPYRSIAAALDLNEASVGTLLARATRQLRQAYEGTDHAP